VTAPTLYLSGAVRELYATAGLGFMFNPAMGNRRPDGAAWAADNGCFTAGDRFDPGAWLAWLDRQDRGHCMFAVAPDVVGDAAATAARSSAYLPTIRRLGFAPAYVAQDGWDAAAVDWTAFDVLFIGGSTEFKVGAVARGAVLEAQGRGKRVHMGRVNSGRRFALAASWGCDSVDGTYLCFTGPPGLPDVLGWMRAAAQPDLWARS